jgi:hypothetical protein
MPTSVPNEISFFARPKSFCAMREDLSFPKGASFGWDIDLDCVRR